MRHRLLIAAAVSTAALSACGDKDDTGASAPFEAGEFLFTNTAVSDGCLDGGFTVLFLPEGDGSESDWAYPIELPGWDSLPASYAIQLQEPFSSMDITVTDGGTDQLVMAGALQSSVVFNEDSYPDCTVDLSIDATINIETSSSVTGQALMSVSNASGDTCPVFNDTPCQVALDFYGSRK